MDHHHYLQYLQVGAEIEILISTKGRNIQAAGNMTGFQNKG